MNYELVRSYTFNPNSRTIVLNDYSTVHLERLNRIFNVTRGQLLYDLDNPNLNAEVSGNIVTLNFNTSGASANDVLAIEYAPLAGETVYGATASPSALTTLNTNLGATNDTAANSDTGTFSLIALTKRIAQRLTSLMGLIAPASTALNTYSVRITSNDTTTPVASTVYVSSIAITVATGGTTSTIIIQDKSGTPLRLVNSLPTATANTTPTVLNFETPIKMTGGIDIVTAGATPATVSVWINYYA